MRGKHKLAVLYLLFLSALAFQALGHRGDRSDEDCLAERNSHGYQCLRTQAAPAVRAAPAHGRTAAPRGGGTY